MTESAIRKVEQVASLRDRISESLSAANLSGFIEGDRDFHLGLLDLHGNARLVDMVRELRSQTRMINLARMTMSEELPESAREHHVMLDLLGRRDGAALEALTIKHLGHVIGWWAGNSPDR